MEIEKFSGNSLTTQTDTQNQIVDGVGERMVRIGHMEWLGWGLHHMGIDIHYGNANFYTNKKRKKEK